MNDFGREAAYYDRIITGDLGYVGSEILETLLLKEGIDIRSVHDDCGKMIYDKEEQKVHAGGSGCGCCASVLCAYIIPKIEKGFWKRVLFVPTGALMSRVSFSEGNTVPGIAQAVVLEREE